MLDCRSYLHQSVRICTRRHLNLSTCDTLAVSTFYMSLRVPVGAVEQVSQVDIVLRNVGRANTEVIPGCRLGADCSRGLRGWTESRMRLWYIIQVDLKESVGPTLSCRNFEAAVRQLSSSMLIACVCSFALPTTSSKASLRIVSRSSTPRFWCLQEIMLCAVGVPAFRMCCSQAHLDLDPCRRISLRMFERLFEAGQVQQVQKPSNDRGASRPPPGPRILISTSSASLSGC